MTISYKWLLDYLPEPVEVEKLLHILNAIGLEVESAEAYEEVKGGLNGLIIGEVLEVSKHPNADKLSVTKVNVGSNEPLQIVCGAPNVAAGQKVLVAPVGATIYPLKSDPLTMRVAKIRGVESFGMICAEDEVGLGESHAGIMVLPPTLEAGKFAKDHFQPYDDTIISIGLTPNRSDAMSHMGVARDVCAWLNLHEDKNFSVRMPERKELRAESKTIDISVAVENTVDCPRYAGIGFDGITVKPSPKWMQQRLKAIGVRPINNIVDITNYVLHETGQPLHAFDADRITGQKIIVKNLPAGTSFISLDEKERKLDKEDLMICDGNENGMCIGGVFGGFKSGVSSTTTKIFLESAWFNPTSIRKSSFRHNLRTDAAMHFEKGVDISNTVEVLRRAAALITAEDGVFIASDLQDVYPSPSDKKIIDFSFIYLQKISGKVYSSVTVKKILESLGFTVLRQDDAGMSVAVPFHKTDITLPADIAEEVMRLDGFDNILIPTTISIAPAVETLTFPTVQKEKISTVLAGQGFNEILNNSISNSAWYTDEELEGAVKMMNNLSAELNILRPSMLETGLQTVAHNLNRKNNELRLFEFGKTYFKHGAGKYEETEHLAIFLSGSMQEPSWNTKARPADLYFLKGVIQSLAAHSGINQLTIEKADHPKLNDTVKGVVNNSTLFIAGRVSAEVAGRFDIRQEVWYADIFWENWIKAASANTIRFKEIGRFPAVNRDLAFVVDKHLEYSQIEKTARSLSIGKLKDIGLFDIFESDKLGEGKKSMAMSFVFQDDEKTLTDSEVEQFMQKIITIFEKDLNAQIRR
jgi:phenylalanyl-tRNA synthetase beta chain